MDLPRHDDSIAKEVYEREDKGKCIQTGLNLPWKAARKQGFTGRGMSVTWNFH